MPNWREAVKYRNRADIVREIAGEVIDQTRGGVLLAIADDFERMAARIESDLKLQIARPRRTKPYQ